VLAGGGASQGINKQNALSGNAPTQVLRLTLNQAVGLALNRTPRRRLRSYKRAERARQKYCACGPAPSQCEHFRRSEKGKPAGPVRRQEPFPGFPKTLDHIKLFSAGPSFGAPVFDLTLWRRYQAARDTVNASKANSLSTREQVILLVVSQYIGTLRASGERGGVAIARESAQALYDQAADLQKEAWAQE